MIFLLFLQCVKTINIAGDLGKDFKPNPYGPERATSFKHSCLLSLRNRTGFFINLNYVIMRNDNLMIKERFSELVSSIEGDLCREAKNYLHENLVLYANSFMVSGSHPPQSQHDDYMIMHTALYEFFDSLDCLFAEDLLPEGKRRKE
jgi:hypothetical protein